MCCGTHQRTTHRHELSSSTVWVPHIKLRSPGCVAGDFTHWAIYNNESAWMMGGRVYLTGGKVERMGEERCIRKF